MDRAPPNRYSLVTLRNLVGEWNGNAKTQYVGHLNEAQLRPRFNKSLDLQIFSLVDYFEKINAFLVCTICFYETVHYKLSLDKSFRQTENDLERSFVKHWLNSV